MKYFHNKAYHIRSYIANLTVTGSSTDQKDTLRVCVSLTRKNCVFK